MAADKAKFGVLIQLPHHPRHRAENRPPFLNFERSIDPHTDVGQGFERLNDAMIRQAAAGTTGVERLELCGRAYVNFALRWPGHFTAMFDLAPQSGEDRLQ